MRRIGPAQVSRCITFIPRRLLRCRPSRREEWRFWKFRQPPPVGLPYVGGEGDSYRIDSLTPCADVIHSDPLLSLTGALPHPSTPL
jgi:hypothetical protein